MCISKSDINDKKYYKNDNNYYYLCSNSLDNYVQCDNEIRCIKCNAGYELDEDDKCISQNLINKNLYYLDNTQKKYASCSKILNCETCSQYNYCIKCKNNFYIIDDDHSKCENLSSEKY